MDLTCSNVIEIQKATLEEKGKIRRLFSLSNPKYSQYKRMFPNRFTPKNIPKTIPYYAENSGGIFVPGGSLHILEKHFDIKKIERPEGVSRVPSIKLTEPIEPREWQVEALDIIKGMSSHGNGIFKVPTAGGKSIFGALIINELKTKTLIICETTIIFEQWIAIIEDLFKMKAGKIKAKDFKVEDITVAMSQTLSNRKKEMDEYKGEFGLVLVDECQMIGPSASITSDSVYNRMGVSVQRIPSPFKFGLTDAAMRSDGQGASINFVIGPILFEVPFDELEEFGAVIKPKLVVRKTELQIDPQKLKDGLYVECVWDLIKDDARLNLILKDLLKEEKEYNLVLANNKTFLRMLLGALLSKNPDLGSRVAIITGNTPKKMREKYLELARNGKVNFLFATSLADRGMDIPILNRLHLVFPSKFEGNNKQRLGRVVRSCLGKKEAIVYDYVDSEVSVFRRQFLNRNRYVYRERCTVDEENAKIIRGIRP